MNSADTPPTRKIAIVGGGMSGLASAHRLLELGRKNEQAVEIMLFDAADRLGGIVGTKHIGNYLVEMGADSFITNKPWAVDLCRRLGIEDRLIPTEERFRKSLVLRKGRPLEVPEGFMLLAPAKILPVLKSPLFSLQGKLRMGLEYFLPRKKNDEDESLANFVRRRFGKEVLDRLVQPLVGGIYTSDPEKLSLKATMPRFLQMEKEFRSLIRASRRSAEERTQAEKSGSGARYGLFATLQGGISELVDALYGAIKTQCRIELQTQVTSVQKNNSRWSIALQDGSKPEFDAVILALPAYRAAELVRESQPALARGLEGIAYASSAIVVSGHRLEDIDHPLDAFGLVIPHIEGREVLAVSFGSRKFSGRAPEGRVILRTFVGGAMQPEVFEKTDAEIFGIVQRELKEMLGVTWKPDFCEIARYPRSMPQYYVGHLDCVEQIENRTAKMDGLALAGNEFRGVGLPDAIHSGEKAAEQIFQSTWKSSVGIQTKGM